MAHTQRFNAETPGVGRRQQARDRRVGRRDGRRNIPSLGDALRQRRSHATVESAYQQAITADMFAAASGLGETFDHIRAAAQHALDELEGKANRQRLVVQRLAERIEEAGRPLTEIDLLPRNADEESRSAESIRYRREIMREYRVLRAKREHEAAEQALAALIEQRERMRRQLEEDLERVRAQVRRLRDQYAVRVSAYWHGVTSTHRNGRHLARLVGRPDLPLPPWATAPVGPEPTDDPAVTDSSTPSANDRGST